MQIFAHSETRAAPATSVEIELWKGKGSGTRAALARGWGRQLSGQSNAPHQVSESWVPTQTVEIWINFQVEQFGRALLVGFL